MAKKRVAPAMGDAADIRALLAAGLEYGGFKVHTVDDGVSKLGAAALLKSGLRMPVRSGRKGSGLPRMDNALKSSPFLSRPVFPAQCTSFPKSLPVSPFPKPLSASV